MNIVQAAQGLVPCGRAFASQSNKVVPLPLAQTGEGIKECELISWFVEVKLPLFIT